MERPTMPDHVCEEAELWPIAEAGPAPTTAAPVEQLSGKVVEGQPPRECAFCDTTEVNGVNINECSSCLTLCCTAHSEDADNQRVLCINCAPEDEPVPAEQPGKADEDDHADDCTDPNCHKRHTIPAGKAADPRPAQPQAPAEWRSPEYKLTLPELFDRATEWSTHRFALDFHAAAEHLRHPPEVAAPLREERDRLAGRLKALESRWKDASEQINAAKYMVEKARDCERAEKAVAERDTRIATLEQASWSFAEWAERAQCFGCDVEFSEDPEPDDTQPCECCESIRRSYRLVIAAIGRERVQSLRGRAALGAPEGQPGDYDPMTAPVPEGDMNGPHGPIPAPEGQPPAAPSEAPLDAPPREQELLGKEGDLLKLLGEARSYIGYGAAESMNGLCARIDAVLSAPPRKAPQEAMHARCPMGNPGCPCQDPLDPAPSSPEEQLSEVTK